jgi:hypothetical protein
MHISPLEQNEYIFISFVLENNNDITTQIWMLRIEESTKLSYL